MPNFELGSARDSVPSKHRAYSEDELGSDNRQPGALSKSHAMGKEL